MSVGIIICKMAQHTAHRLLPKVIHTPPDSFPADCMESIPFHAMISPSRAANLLYTM